MDWIRMNDALKVRQDAVHFQRVLLLRRLNFQPGTLLPQIQFSTQKAYGSFKRPRLNTLNVVDA